MAVKYYNERKGMLEDIGKITAGKDFPGMRLPDYVKQSYIHQKELHFRGRIEPDELEIAIVGASNIKPPSGYVTVDSYIAVTCPMATAEPTIWKTHKVSNTNSPGK